MPLALSRPFYSMGTQRELGPSPLDTSLPQDLIAQPLWLGAKGRATLHNHSASSKGENIPGLGTASGLAILAKSSMMI